jgi:hypothetical protein
LAVASSALACRLSGQQVRDGLELRSFLFIGPNRLMRGNVRTLLYAARSAIMDKTRQIAALGYVQLSMALGVS